MALFAGHRSIIILIQLENYADPPSMYSKYTCEGIEGDSFNDISVLIL